MMWCRKLWRFLGIEDLLLQVDCTTYLLSSCPWWRYFTLSFRYKTQGYLLSTSRSLLLNRQGNSQWKPKAFSSGFLVWKRLYLDTQRSFLRRACFHQSKPECLGPRYLDGLVNLKRSWFQTILSILRFMILYPANCLSNTTKGKQRARSWE